MRLIARLRIAAGVILIASTTGWSPPLWSQTALEPGSSVPPDTTLLPIWGSDEGAERNEVICYIPVLDSLPVDKKIEVVCQRLGQLVFGWGRVQLMRIDTVDGRSIAEIDLVGDSIGEPWSRHYFQGSTGGGYTTITLRRAFLQDTYHGSWVNGVRFHLNGEPIQDVWDHIFLSGIFYRKDAARPGDKVPYGDQ